MCLCRASRRLRIPRLAWCGSIPPGNWLGSQIDGCRGKFFPPKRLCCGRPPRHQRAHSPSFFLSPLRLPRNRHRSFRSGRPHQGSLPLYSDVEESPLIRSAPRDFVSSLGRILLPLAIKAGLLFPSGIVPGSPIPFVILRRPGEGRRGISADVSFKLTVNFGDHSRALLSGVKKELENPREIEGRQALFVVNLELMSLSERGTSSTRSIVPTRISNASIASMPTAGFTAGGVNSAMIHRLYCAA